MYFIFKFYKPSIDCSLQCSLQGTCCLFLYSKQTFSKVSRLSSVTLKSLISSIILIKYFLRKFDFRRLKRSMIKLHSPSKINSFKLLSSVRLAYVLKRQKNINTILQFVHWTYEMSTSSYQ